MSAARGALHGVLLDVDGTLLDSNDQHARAWVDALREFGHDVPFDRLRPLIGKGGDKLLVEVTGIEPDSAQGERIAERVKAIFNRDYLPSVQAVPGAHELLETLHAHDLRLVVATSAAREELNKLLRQGGLEELVDRTTTSSDADRSKPDPDIIRAALRRGRLEAEHVIMVGDTPYDVEAAGRAGIDTVAFRCGGWWSDEALSGAIAIYDGPADLRARYDDSPFAQRHGVEGNV